MAREWQVVVPLKSTARAKTRLGLGADERRLLARAFANDLLAAVMPAVSGAIVVCTAADANSLPGGLVTVTDPGRGLNAAIHEGLASLPPSQPVLVMLADLPCVTSADMDLLLAKLADLRAREPGAAGFVADQAGVGTTMLAGNAGALRCAFGPRSRARHRAQGTVELTGPGLSRLRRDVDALVDLLDAIRMGVGSHTAEAWAAIGDTARA